MIPGSSTAPRGKAAASPATDHHREQRELRSAIVAEIRSRLARLRDDHRLSGRYLDDRLGWARGTWGKTECGRLGGLHLPTERLLEIEHFFGLSEGSIVLDAAKAAQERLRKHRPASEIGA